MRAGLEILVIPSVVERVDVVDVRGLRTTGGSEEARTFETILTGRQFTAINRRGKYLWFVLDDGTAMLAHLGMSGQFRVVDREAPRHRHTRVVIGLGDYVFWISAPSADSLSPRWLTMCPAQSPTSPLIPSRIPLASMRLRDDCAHAGRPSSAACSTRHWYPVSATFMPTKPCGGFVVTRRPRARASASARLWSCWRQLVR